MDTFVQPPAGIIGTGPGGMLKSSHSVYNARDERTEVQDALGHAAKTEYNSRGLPFRTFDRSNGKTEMFYDALGRLTETHQHVNALGLGVLITKNDYDANGNRKFLTDPRGMKYEFQYDSADRMTLMKTPLAKTESWAYTDHGELFTHTDANGKVATMTYDDDGRLTKEEHKQGAVTLADVRRIYDGSSNLKRLVDLQTGVAIDGLYTKKNELEKTTWRLNATDVADGQIFREIAYSYFGNGNRKTMAGPDGELVEYGYNARNLPETVKRNGALFVQLGYDSSGRRSQVLLQNGVTGNYTYTAREELHTLKFASAAQTLVDCTYHYDARGNRDQFVRADLGVTGAFQNLPVVDWLFDESWTGAVTHHGGFTYDEAGNRKTHVKDAATCTYNYDNDNRLTQQLCQIVTGFNPGAVVQVAGTPTVDSTKPGRNAAVIANGATTDNSAPPFAWANNDTGPAGAGPHFAGLLFGSTEPTDKIEFYVPTGPANAFGIARFKFQALIGGTWTDLAATVTGATPSATPGWFQTTSPMTHLITATYAPVASTGVRVIMDAGGGSSAHPNRMMVNELKAFKTLPGTPIIQTQTIGYGYDENGNQLSRTEQLGVVTTKLETFGYDYMNRLEFYLHQSGGGATVSQFSYLATPQGQRLCKSNGTTSDWSMYDGMDCVSDYTLSGATFTPTAAYVQTMTTDSKWFKIDAGGQPHAYLPDGLGSVARIVNQLGVTVDARLTTAWGEPMPGFTPPGPDRFGYTQRERDDESSLMYFRARALDPRTGRFIQKDPDDPIHQHYAYVGNSPLFSGDPTGRQPSRGGHTMVGEGGEWWDPRTQSGWDPYYGNIRMVPVGPPYVPSDLDAALGVTFGILGGLLEAGWGAATGNYAVAAHGFDVYMAATGSAESGEPQATYTAQGAYALARSAGLSEEASGWVALGADVAPTFYMLKPSAGGAGAWKFADDATLYAEMGGDMARLERALVTRLLARDVALGTREGLYAFAEERGAFAYRDWGKAWLVYDESLPFVNFPKAFQEATGRAGRIFFKADDFKIARFRAWASESGEMSHGFTNWELSQLYKNPSLWNKTVFFEEGVAMTPEQVTKLKRAVKEAVDLLER